MVAKVPDARLWSLAVACLEQAYPEKWPQFFAELILYAPGGQCDALAKRVENADRGELLVPIAERIIEQPGRFTDGLMWLWRGPEIERDLHLPSSLELFNIVMALVGPVRVSEGKALGQTPLEMRGKVRTGLSHKDYARFRACIADLDDSLAQAVRRTVERAEGLGPTLQDEMNRILRTRFPNLYLKPRVAMWDDDSVYYYTRAGLKTKEDELADVVNVKMRENAKAIGEAAAHGDLSENSEYKFALEERDLLRARVAKLNREISMAKVLERGEIPTDYVSIGQCVTLRPMHNGTPLTLKILGYDESDISNHIYSYHSPLAREMLGKKPGDAVKLNLDEGPREFMVDRVEPAIE
jgi:transcription elongation factor GreA